MYSKQSQFWQRPAAPPDPPRSVPILPRGRNATPRSWRSIAHKLVVIGQGGCTDFGLGRGEAEAIVLALAEKARVLGIADKNGINACKLLGVVFTTAIGILVRMGEKRLLTINEALLKLETLAKHARYEPSILEDARRRLETAT
jgi:hypothetical protein